MEEVTPEWFVYGMGVLVVLDVVIVILVWLGHRAFKRDLAQWAGQWEK